jgi:hypothetical protein
MMLHNPVDAPILYVQNAFCITVQSAFDIGRGGGGFDLTDPFNHQIFNHLILAIKSYGRSWSKTTQVAKKCPLEIQASQMFKWKLCLVKII